MLMNTTISPPTAIERISLSGTSSSPTKPMITAAPLTRIVWPAALAAVAAASSRDCPSAIASRKRESVSSA